MLIELRIRDFAVIDEIALELGPGLNVLSGETGAGKSIVVGALSLLLGERASSDVVRVGSRRATVEGVFDVSERPAVLARLNELGIEPEDGLLILKRQVAAAGRNRAWINGSPATAGVVGQLGSELVDLHGQHEHQTLLRPGEQRALLDAYAGAQELALSVAGRHRRLRDLDALLTSKEERQRELESRGDFVRFQLAEIDDARLENAEDRALEDEARRLAHSEDLVRDASRIHEALYGADEALSDTLADLQKILERAASLDPSLAAESEAMAALYHGAVELGRRLGDYASAVEQDPRRLDEIRGRLDRLFRLKRKYGPELSDVLATGERLRAELEELGSASLDLGALRRERESIRSAMLEEAAQLRVRREAVAGRLAHEVGALLPDLGMTGAVFEVTLQDLAEAGPHGTESVQFRASLNAGFEPLPLPRIASGGELSRVMLALKAVLADVDAVPTLVFDEIDAGIGGVVASRVADTLRSVARRHQVFVVTHLPQLASRAHAHFLVSKDEQARTALTAVHELQGEDRVTEIARMLGGDPESATSRDHARELLQTA